LVTNATTPALSPNRQFLLYHAELIDSEGFHILDLTTGEDRRITLRRHHILPRWGGSDTAFIFVAEEPGTGRWQIQQGFADGKSEPIILLDGRTPDWSPDGSTIAYQGVNPQGNEPGLYLAPFGGGEARRLTDHESDRTPIFSPNGAQLAYMSTRNGNWDIYTISAAGGSPRQLTTNSGSDGLPTWSPDGSRIAYVSDTGGSWAIYTIPAGGGTPSKVADWDGSRHADWLVAQIWWTR
jgi:serine/threonine-protein kinase